MLFYSLLYLSDILSLHYMCNYIYLLLSPIETFMYRSGLYQVNKCKCKSTNHKLCASDIYLIETGLLKTEDLKLCS